jgi:TatD DNase family protein
MLIDTHAHLYANEFDNDRAVVIENALKNGVKKMLLPNIDLESIEGLHQLAETYPQICYPMMGLHPTSVNNNFKSVLTEMKTFIDSKNYIAIGEIGMDLYWDKTYINEQAEALKIQIEWAKEKKLPVVIHVREAFDEIFEVIDPLNDDNLFGVFHCFTGTLEQAKKILNYGGFKLGVGGVLTFKNSGLDQVIKGIGLEHLVLETDAPYLAPTPHRGKRNESAYVTIIADKLADVKGVSGAEINKITTQNAKTVFNL